LIKQDKEGQSILIKGEIQQKEITIISLYAPIDRSSKQKINKEILELNHTIDQMDLADVYRIFHPTAAQYTFFSAAHGIFCTIDYILGHNTGLSKYKKIEIIACILSDHKCIKTRTQQQKQQ
jgi:exonuclease III